MSAISLRATMLFSALLLLAPWAQQAGAVPLAAGHPPRITVEQVKDMLDSGDEVLLIDTRAQGQWATSKHKARGAIRVDTPRDLQNLVVNYPPDKPIVIYCT